MYGTKGSWPTIAKLIPGKSEIKCHTRWLELNNIGNCILGTWKMKEDEILTRFVDQYGAQNWTKASEYLPGRIGKQCRERWFNHLDPTIKKDDWKLEEDIEIVRLHLSLGNKWA